MAHVTINFSLFETFLNNIWLEGVIPNLYVCSADEGKAYDTTTDFLKNMYGETGWNMVYDVYLNETNHENEIIENLKSFCETKTFNKSQDLSNKHQNSVKIIRLRIYEHEMSLSFALFLRETIDLYQNVRILIVSMRMSNLHEELQSSIMTFMVHSLNFKQMTKMNEHKNKKDYAFTKTTIPELDKLKMLDDKNLALEIIQKERIGKYRISSNRTIVHG